MHRRVRVTPATTELERLELDVLEAPLPELAGGPLVRRFHFRGTGQARAENIGHVLEGVDHLGSVEPLVANPAHDIEVDRLPGDGDGGQGGEDERKARVRAGEPGEIRESGHAR